MSNKPKAAGPDEFAKTMDHVFVVDEFGVRHNGLVTNGWGGESPFPCINVTYIVADVKKTDQYGRQKEHLSSLSHASRTPAPGRYWYKDAAWAKETERDAYVIQQRALDMEKQEWTERCALREEAQAEYEATRKGGPIPDEVVAKWKTKWAEFDAKWKERWASK